MNTVQNRAITVTPVSLVKKYNRTQLHDYPQPMSAQDMGERETWWAEQTIIAACPPPTIPE